MQALVTKQGHNGRILVYEDHIELDRTGYNLAAWTAGLHGSHTFHFSDIASINFKRRGLFVGWLKFDVKSHNKNFVSNDYSLTFIRHNDEWEQLAEYIKETVYEYKRIQQKASL